MIELKFIETSQSGVHKYDVVASPGATLKDLIRYVIEQSEYAAGKIYFTCTDPSLEHIEFLGKSEKTIRVCVDYCDRKIITVSNVYLYNENLNVEIDTTKENKAYAQFSGCHYEIYLV